MNEQQWLVFIGVVCSVLIYLIRVQMLKKSMAAKDKSVAKLHADLAVEKLKAIRMENRALVAEARVSKLETDCEYQNKRINDLIDRVVSIAAERNFGPHSPNVQALVRKIADNQSHTDNEARTPIPDAKPLTLEAGLQ